MPSLQVSCTVFRVKEVSIKFSSLHVDGKAVVSWVGMSDMINCTSQQLLGCFMWVDWHNSCISLHAICLPECIVSVLISKLQCKV